MKYILAIGIFFKKFRNSTQIRISSDNLFIDEIVLDEDLKGVERPQIAHGTYHDAMELLNPKKPTKNNPTPFPEKIYLYELDASALGERLYFECNDQNSNYTNGFMTRSNLFAIHNVLLFPKQLFSHKRIHRTAEFLRKIYNSVDLDSLITDHDFNEYRRKYIPWPCYADLIDSNITVYRRLTWFGGKIKLHMEIKEKFGMHFLCNPDHQSSKPIKFGNPKEFIEYNRYYSLINTINENTRSNC